MALSAYTSLRVDIWIQEIRLSSTSRLGFTNRCYPMALATATSAQLPSGTTIRLATPPLFLATKFVAFADRGKADYLFSYDLGDLIAVIDGRDEPISECLQCAAELRCFLRENTRALLATHAFHDALAGHLPSNVASQVRLPGLLAKLHTIADLE